MIHRSALTGLLIIVVSAGMAWGQGTKADYQRADGLGRLSSGKVFRTKVTPHWSKDNSRFWYRNDLAEGSRQFVIVDVARGVRAPAFDHAKVAVALARATGKRCSATRLPTEHLVFTEDPGAIRFYALGSG